MDETMKEKKFTLAKSCQDWCEGFHWRGWGRDNFFLALKASRQKISTFISSHLDFFLSPDSALRDDWIFDHLVFFWNTKTEINQIRSGRYFLVLSDVVALSVGSNVWWRIILFFQFPKFYVGFGWLQSNLYLRSTKCCKNPLAITERLYSAHYSHSHTPTPHILYIFSSTKYGGVFVSQKQTLI